MFIFTSIALILFVGRNIIRLNKEITFYNYNLLKSPHFYVKDIKSKKILENNEFKVFSPINGMCWASQTPCSYRKNMKAKKVFSFNVVYK